MTNKKILGLLVVIIVLGFGLYVVKQPEVIKGTTSTASPTPAGKTSIVWSLTDAGENNGTPSTKVSVVINNKAYEVGQFEGSCNEIGANGGIDSKGLLAGELSSVQCWFAGSGDEIGVFAHEDGGFDIMVGSLSEGEEGSGLFRGDFKVRQTIPF